ncbi:MAG: Ig-like domain-containing protein, partial [Desulfobacterales bacterium]|nr:Ig-like domain-containing protein [Desulfobacterales bacterium]
MKRCKDRQTHLMFIIILSIFLIITGCNGGSNDNEATGELDTTAPTLTLTAPAVNATNVAVNAKITATFNEAMDPSTITTTTFILQQGVKPISGVVNYSGVTAIFSPIEYLEFNTFYTATIKIDASDPSGNKLAGGDYVWSFTTGAAPDTTAPIVILTDPANYATGINFNMNIAATFSEVMDPLTITTETFTVKGPDGTPVSGTVTYSGVTAVFKPTSYLASSTTYTAFITTGVKDLSGNAQLTDYIWSFTTGAVSDITSPTVIFTSPADNANGVAINTKITATFSEAMDPSTITTTTFILKQEERAIPGVVNYSGVTAVFTPIYDLEYDTFYTATITIAARDTAGNILAGGDYVWNFTTGAKPDTTSPTVILTSPADLSSGILVNTKIAAIFNEVMNPLTITTETFTVKRPDGTLVSGTVTYSGVTAEFTPIKQLEYNTVYTAAITTGAGDLSGNRLSGDYVWSFTTGAAPAITIPIEIVTPITPIITTPIVTYTTPSNGSTNVAIKTQITATFSEVMNPLTISTTTFSIKQGTIPVSGSVNYSGVTAVFTPLNDLSADTIYTAMISGAKSLAGYPMANYEWRFTTGTSPDTIAPTVTFTSPADKATGVSIKTQITATFSEKINPITITTATFTLKHGETSISGNVMYSDLTAVFIPIGNLSADTAYTATIKGAKDLVGNTIISYEWSFFTGAVPDTTAPSVTYTAPSAAAKDVAVNTRITATFNEEMDPLTITTTTFTLEKGENLISGTVTYSGVTAVFTPLKGLEYDTTYTATIKTGAKDLAGNTLANYVWNFTTGLVPDTTAPRVTHTAPPNSAKKDVAINTRITATFNEEMDPLTITTTTFILENGENLISGTVIYSGVTAVFTPLQNIEYETTYTATIKNGAKDLAGNSLEKYQWRFTTGAAPDTTAPSVTHTAPFAAAKEVAVNTRITATFNEEMDPLTINTTTFSLQNGTNLVSGTVIYSGVTAVFTPLQDLEYDTTYIATIKTGAKDLAGNTLANYQWSFTTGALPDTISPSVTHTAPSAAAKEVAVNKRITATFNEEMDPLTITTTTFSLQNGTNLVSGTVIYSGVTAVFTPLDDLEYDTTYIATIKAGAKDLAGNTLANYQWSFTTGAAPDTTAPSVTHTAPSAFSKDVAINTRITATFNEEMDPLTITTTTFSLQNGTNLVSGTVIYSGVTGIFTPLHGLEYSTTYTATIKSGAKDLAGNTLANYQWSFTTGALPDTISPSVTLTAPSAAAKDVAINTRITATFNEEMDPLTITTTTFTLQQGTNLVFGTVIYSGVTALFTPLYGLEYSTTYTATIKTGAKDLAGNTLANYQWSFTTGALPD